MIEAIFLFAWFIIAGHVQDDLHADIIAERVEVQEQEDLYEYMDALSIGRHGRHIHAVLNSKE